MAWTRKGRFIEAVKNGDIDVVRSAIESEGEAYANLDQGYKTSPLWIAFSNMDTPMINLLLENKAVPEGVHFQALLESEKSSDQKSFEATAKILLAHKVKITPECFKIAIEKAHFSAVSCFLKNITSPQDMPSDILSEMIDANAPEHLIIEALHAGGDDKNNHGSLLSAAKNGMITLTKALLERGYDINAKEKKSGSYTALHVAIYSNNIGMVQFLLDNGAKINITDDSGRSAVAHARYYDRSPGIIALLEEAEKREARLVKINAPDSSEEYWHKCGGDQVAYVGIFPQITRKVTEIFNFAARERTVIIENIAEKKETVSPPQSFNTVEQARLKQAFAAFTAQGGLADEAYVFSSKRAGGSMTIIDGGVEIPMASARPALAGSAPARGQA